MCVNCKLGFFVPFFAGWIFTHAACNKCVRREQVIRRWLLRRERRRDWLCMVRWCESSLLLKLLQVLRHVLRESHQKSIVQKFSWMRWFDWCSSRELQIGDACRAPKLSFLHARRVLNLSTQLAPRTKRKGICILVYILFRTHNYQRMFHKISNYAN